MKPDIYDPGKEIDWDEWAHEKIRLGIGHLPVAINPIGGYFEFVDTISAKDRRAVIAAIDAHDATAARNTREERERLEAIDRKTAGTILTRFPVGKQLTMKDRRAEIEAKGSPTVEETAELAKIKRREQWIKDVLTAGNAAEKAGQRVEQVVYPEQPE